MAKRVGPPKPLRNFSSRLPAVSLIVIDAKNRVFQHRVMGESSSAGRYDRPGFGRGDPTWTILLASISRWTRRMFAFSIAKALLLPQLSQPIPSFEVIETMLVNSVGRDAAFLHENQTEQAGLTQRVLDAGSRATCERGNGGDVRGTDPLAGVFLQRLAIGRDRLLIVRPALPLPKPEGRKPQPRRTEKCTPQ